MNLITVKRKLISALLIGSLAASGVMVYADTAGTQNAAPEGTPKQEMRQGMENLLQKLVDEDLLTADEMKAIQDALAQDRQERKAEADTTGTAPAQGERPDPSERQSPFDRLAEDGVITAAQAEKIDTYLQEERDARFAEETKSLVDSGAFESTEAVKTALDAVREAMKDKLDAEKPATADTAQRPEKPDLDALKNMTQEEREAYRKAHEPTEEQKAQMQARQKEMKEKHEAALKAVLASLVSDGTLTDAQADALQAFMTSGNGMMPGGPGHGHGPMGQPPQDGQSTEA